MDDQPACLQPHAFSVLRLDHVALRVTDMNRSMRWYETVLGFERRYSDVWERPVMVVAGHAAIALFDADATSAPVHPAPKIGFSHFALLVDRIAFEQAQAAFTRKGIIFTFEDHSICHSIYLHDPDQYRVELTTYEM